ncbi:MAG: GreA/GreB family elongation factor [Bacilli bacterium]
MINKPVMLLPKQVEEHKKELEELRQRLTSLTSQQSEIGSRNAGVFSGTYTNPDSISDSIDSSLLMELSRISKRISEIEGILSSFAMVTQVNNDVIGIGTTFSFRINNSNEMTLTLVEKFGDPNMGLISLESPIGAAVYGKTVGESFTYKLFNGKDSFGVITNIVEKVVEPVQELKK